MKIKINHDLTAFNPEHGCKKGRIFEVQSVNYYYHPSIYYIISDAKYRIGIFGDECTIVREGKEKSE